MEVTLKNVSLDISVKDFLDACNSVDDYSNILSKLGDVFSILEDHNRRILMNSIAKDMSINGRLFIEQMYANICILKDI